MTSTEPKTPLSWLTPGNSRFLLIVFALTVILAASIVFSLTTSIAAGVAFGATVNAAMLVLGALLNASGARQGADATASGVAAVTGTNGTTAPAKKP